MVFIRNLSCTALAALAMGMLPCRAAEPSLGFDLKMRTGLTAGPNRLDHRDNKTFGFALGARKPFMGGTAFGELAYDIFPGQGRDVMPTGGTVYGPTGALNPDGKPYTLSAANSVDIRKESSQGFGLRCGYMAPVAGWDGLSWQVGLTLDAYSTRSQVDITLRPLVDGVTVDATGHNTTTASARYYEAATFVKRGASLAPGLFVGLTQKVNDDIRLEVNLRNQGLKHFDYAPATYTGRPAALSESTRRVTTLEVGLALNL